MPKVAQEWWQIWRGGQAPTSRWQPTMPVLLIEGCATTPAAKAIMGASGGEFSAREAEARGRRRASRPRSTVNALIAEFIAKVDTRGGESAGGRGACVGLDIWRGRYVDE